MQKLFIKKFKTIEDKEISIPCQISGGNGTGKSTILEAISFVFTGKNLDGKEFEQVYHRDEDLHDAVADVTYFDKYGNSWQRIVKPIFQTNRQGIEEVKIKRSTECRKNGIICNDFSDEFQDFYKFGTDYFFNQKEDLQRSIFIDALKLKMPDFDINSASLSLKEAKKAHKEELSAVENIQSAIKNTKDVSVPKMPDDVLRENNQYLSLSSTDNSELIAEINKKNNEISQAYFVEKQNLNNDIVRKNLAIQQTERDIEREESYLIQAQNEQFQPEAEVDLSAKKQELSMAYGALHAMEFFETIEHYAQENFTKNPVLVANGDKILALSSGVIEPSTTTCPLTSESCQIAAENSKKAEIEKIKNDNRIILSAEMSDNNAKYINQKSVVDGLQSYIDSAELRNLNIKKLNEEGERSFDTKKATKINNFKQRIEKLKSDLESLKKEHELLKSKLENMKEPELARLPEVGEISEELKFAHSEFERISKEIIGAKAINQNNKKLNEEREVELKVKRENLLSLLEKINALNAQITDYFSNLQNVVKQEFAGSLEIDVELQEYVMSRDEWKDCFKITVNGKVFPYELNGALINNAKLQILAGLQRLKGYSGLTIMDNCEANTTQPIEICGLNAVLTFATFDKELIIK